MTRNQNLTKFYVFSLLLHLALWWGASQFSPVSRSTETPIEVVYEGKERRFLPHMKALDLPDQLKTKDDRSEAHMGATERMRVKKEMIANQLGMENLNKNSNRPLARPFATDRLKQLDLRKRIQFDGDVPLKTAKREPLPHDNRPLNINPGVGASQTTHVRTDVEQGPFTALNADRYIFASFYDRMEDRIGHRWRSYVKQLWDEARMRRRDIRPGSWVTVAEVLLSPQGDYVRTLVLSSSGWVELDSAMDHAFREAGTIPNPPPEMVRDDGYIHLQIQGSFNIF